MAHFQTAVSEVRAGDVSLRGYSLSDVMRKLSYTDGAHLSIIGRLPSESESRLLDVFMNSLLDHGFVASTITAARYIASGNPQFVPAVAGGLLAAGSNTLSPEHSGRLLARAQVLRESQGLDFDGAAAAVVAEYRVAGLRLPGFGHPTHKTSDFRADILFDVAEREDLAGDSVRQFRAIQRALFEASGKSLPINIDGAMAAVGRDLRWTTEQTVAFALLSVLPGLMGHVIEELERPVPLRYITDGEYVGEPDRALP